MILDFIKRITSGSSLNKTADNEEKRNCTRIDFFQASYYRADDESDEKDIFDCWINNEETLGAVRSILVTSFWNIPWFTELGEQAQAIISYMEKSYPDI